MDKINELFGEDDERHIDLFDMALILMFLEYNRKNIYSYYLAMYRYFIDVFGLSVDTLLESFYISPDVNLTLDMIYNKNVNRSVFDTLDMQRNSFEKHLRAQILALVNQGTTVGELKQQLSELSPIKGELSGQSAKSMSVYRTEYTRIRSAVKLYIEDHYKELGYEVSKSWVYTYEARVARNSHLAHDGVKADDGYFIINGKKTKAPGMFGDPSEDINCRCDIHIDISGPK